MCSSHLLHRFDRTLGGLEMELRLREHLAGLFNEQRKGQRANDVRENPRAMAKLLREANRLKTVLSANADHVAQVLTRGCLRAKIPCPAPSQRVEDPATLSSILGWPIPCSHASCLPPSILFPWCLTHPPREQDPGECSDLPIPFPDRGPDG